MDMMESINDLERRAVTRLTSVRRFRHMNQQQLAEAAGMKLPSITALEAGNRNLRLGEAVALCAALGVSIADVVGDEPLTLRTDLTVE